MGAAEEGGESIIAQPDDFVAGFASRVRRGRRLRAAG